MAAFDRDARNLLLGAGIGAAVVLAAPFVIPVVVAAVRPLWKSAVTRGLLAIEVGREKLALLREHAEDVLAEAQVDARELIEQRRARVAGSVAETTAAVEPAANGKTVGQA